MTDSVTGIAGIRKAERDGKNSANLLKRASAKHHDESGDDLVEISEEARQKASGTSKTTGNDINER